MYNVNMKPITQVVYKDLEINFLKEGKFVGYSFGYEGRNYGHKVEVKKPSELLGVVATLTVNAILSFENLKNVKDTN